jgi:hypothetical protein
MISCSGAVRRCLVWGYREFGVLLYDYTHTVPASTADDRCTTTTTTYAPANTSENLVGLPTVGSSGSPGPDGAWTRTFREENPGGGVGSGWGCS